MIFSGHRSNKLGLVLLTAACVTARLAYAADNTAAGTAPKPVAHAPASSTHLTTSTTAKKAGTPATTYHSYATRRTTYHAGTAHPAVRRTTAHAPSAMASKSVSSHSTAYTSQHRSSSARRKPPRPLTGQQRLARLHLQPERVQEIQQALIREGYLQGEATGQWDGRTHEAMQRYQTDHGFPATGLPEAKSLMKLGLGSHPLPSELDHGAVGIANPTAEPGGFTVPPVSPPVSQAVPPS